MTRTKTKYTPHLVTSIRKLARCLGVNVTTGKDYLVSGMPGKVDGYYDVGEAVQWLVRRAEKRRANRASSVPLVKDQADIKFKLERARHYEIKNKKALGDLLPADEVKQFLRIAARTVREFHERAERISGSDDVGDLLRACSDEIDRKIDEFENSEPKDTDDDDDLVERVAELRGPGRTVAYMARELDESEEDVRAALEQVKEA